MSVLKRNRQESQFEVFHHWYKVRKEITDLLLRDFGYDFIKAEKRLDKYFNGRGYEELTDKEKERYDRLKKRNEAFDEWFIEDQRKAVIDCLRNVTQYVFTANTIYPVYMEELVERRLYQDKALGECFRLTQELQYAVTLSTRAKDNR